MKKIISLVLALSFVFSVCPVFAAEENTETVKEMYEKDAVTITGEAEDFLYDRNTAEEKNIKKISYPDTPAGYSKNKYAENATDGKAVLFYLQAKNNQHDESIRVKVDNPGTYNVFIKAKRVGARNDRGSAVYMSVVPYESGEASNSYAYSTNSFDLINNETDSEFVWRYVGPAEITEENNGIYIDVYRGANDQIAVDRICVTNNLYYHPQGDETKQTVSGLSSRYNAENTNLKFPENKKGVHPRLLFSESDISRIKTNFENNEEWYSATSGTDGLRDRVDNKYTTISWANKYHAMTTFESMALYYATGEDASYGRGAIEGTIKVLEFLADISTEESASYNYIDRARDFAVGSAGRVYDWCYNLLTEEEKEKIFSLAMHNMVISEFHFPFKTRAYGEGHQYEQKILRDSLEFAIAVYDEFPDLYNYIAGFLEAEIIPVLNMHFEEGSMHSQGDDYGNTRFMYNLWTTTIFEKLGVNHGISEKQSEMARMNIIRRRFDTGQIMRSGDKWGGTLTSFDTAQTNFLAYNLYNDPYIKKAYEISSTKTQYKSHADHSIIQPVILLILDEPDLISKPLDELPLSTYMGDGMGVMTSRTSWDENAMIVSMGVPEQFYSGHQHHDAGSFEIYYKSPLALDSGYYSDISKPYRYNYTHATIAHNAMLIYNPDEVMTGAKASLLVNSGGQREVGYGKIYSSAEAYKAGNDIGDVLAKGIGDNYSFLKGDITGAYSEEKLNEYTRSFMFLDFKESGTPGALIVLDKVNAKDASFKKTWLLHTKNEPEYLDGAVTSEETINCTCKSSCTHSAVKSYSNNTTKVKAINSTTVNKVKRTSYIQNETLLPKNPVVSKLKGNWNGTLYFPEGETESDKEANGWRIEVNPSEENEVDYFLNVVSVGDEDAVTYDSTLYECDNYLGVKINNFVSFMSKESERTDKEFEISFEDDTDKAFNVIVSDLEGGLWFVKDEDGTVIYNAVVDSDNGTLSFMAPSGNYTLFKENGYPISDSFYAFASVSETVGDYTGPVGIVFAKFNDTFNGYKANEFGMAITNKKLSVDEFMKDSDVIYAPGEKKTEDFRYGIRFYGKAIEEGNTYYTIPYVKYKDSNDNVITVYGRKVIDFTPEKE